MARKIVAEEDRLLTPAEAAELFRVEARTVGRWADEGKLTCVWTVGGHRRYREAEVRALLTAGKMARDNGQLSRVTGGLSTVE